MRQLATRPTPLNHPEVVVNLWVYSDRQGTIMRIAGRAYVMDGDEASKLDLLRKLAATDFLAAEWQKVPPNFELFAAEGQRIRGIADVSMLRDPAIRESLFSRILETLANDIPAQLRCPNGEYEPFRVEMGPAPLSVTTYVIEEDDGRLVPMVGDDTAGPSRP